jgi:hypothetical protein
MKKILALMAVIGCLSVFCATLPSASEKRPINVIFTQSGDQSPREGILIEVKSSGVFELDGGTILNSHDELAAYLKANEKAFAPRLIISSSNPDVDYYHSAMNALLLFKANCTQYSCVIENDGPK